MPGCLCLSLWEELNRKMRKFENTRKPAVDSESLAGQYDLYRHCQTMEEDLREIEVTQQVLSLCPNFIKQEQDSRQCDVPEYLLGPIKEKTVANWVAEEVDSESISGAYIEEMLQTIVHSSLYVEEVGRTNTPGHWVLVYGFEPSQLPLAVATFGQIGELLSCEKSECGNWAAFQYVTARDAERALRHHRSQLNGQVIGVTDKAEFIQKVLCQRSSPQVAPPYVNRGIRALRNRIETRSDQCPAPEPITGWRKTILHVKELLNF